MLTIYINNKMYTFNEKETQVINDNLYTLNDSLTVEEGFDYPTLMSDLVFQMMWSYERLLSIGIEEEDAAWGIVDAVEENNLYVIGHHMRVATIYGYYYKRDSKWHTTGVLCGNPKWETSPVTREDVVWLLIHREEGAIDMSKPYC